MGSSWSRFSWMLQKFWMHNNQGGCPHFLQWALFIQYLFPMCTFLVTTWPNLLQQLDRRPYQRESPWESCYRNLGRAKSIESHLCHWFQPLLEEITKMLPLKDRLHGNAPWLSGSSLLCLYQRCKYFFEDLLQSQHVVAFANHILRRRKLFFNDSRLETFRLGYGTTVKLKAQLFCWLIVSYALFCFLNLTKSGSVRGKGGDCDAKRGF